MHTLLSLASQNQSDEIFTADYYYGLQGGKDPVDLLVELYACSKLNIHPGVSQAKDLKTNRWLPFEEDEFYCFAVGNNGRPFPSDVHDTFSNRVCYNKGRFFQAYLQAALNATQQGQSREQQEVSRKNT